MCSASSGVCVRDRERANTLMETCAGCYLEALFRGDAAPCCDAVDASWWNEVVVPLWRRLRADLAMARERVGALAWLEFLYLSQCVPLIEHAHAHHDARIYTWLRRYRTHLHAHLQNGHGRVDVDCGPHRTRV